MRKRIMDIVSSACLGSEVTISKIQMFVEKSLIALESFALTFSLPRFWPLTALKLSFLEIKQYLTLERRAVNFHRF